MSVCATFFAESIGTEKPTPALSFESPALRIWSLIPITVFVAVSISGPPELPWLIAASVWIAPVIENLFGAVIVRSVALTMPAVIVSGRLNGLPIATTLWPGSTLDESPSASGGAGGDADADGRSEREGQKAPQARVGSAKVHVFGISLHRVCPRVPAIPRRGVREL